MSVVVMVRLQCRVSLGPLVSMRMEVWESMRNVSRFMSRVGAPKNMYVRNVIEVVRLQRCRARLARLSIVVGMMVVRSSVKKSGLVKSATGRWCDGCQRCPMIRVMTPPVAPTLECLMVAGVTEMLSLLLRFMSSLTVVTELRKFSLKRLLLRRLCMDGLFEMLLSRLSIPVCVLALATRTLPSLSGHVGA